MKKYSKPEIVVSLFETNDVISTSCTCDKSKTHYHLQENGLMKCSDGSLYFFSENYIRIVEGCYCPIHGDVYQTTMIIYEGH